MHWANLRLADCSLAVRFELNVPGGCSASHASTAFCHTRGVTLTPYSKSFFAFGSGKSLTPCARMHSENFTAFSRAVSFLVAVLVAVPVAEGAFAPQPVLIKPIRPTMARAAIGRS